MKPKLIAFILFAMAWSPADAATGDAERSIFSFGGFGTVAMVHSNDDKADFTSSPFQAVGAGYTHAWSAAVDSRIAGQVTATLNSRLSAVLQIVAEQNYDNTYVPSVEWANIKYQFTPDSSVRIGRTAVRPFLMTDSRKIGYSNPWVRPPVEVYSLIPLTSIDGVDASYRVPVGAAVNTLQIILGQANYKFPGANGGSSEHVNSRKLAEFVDAFERGFATLRFSYGQTRITIPEFDPLFGAFRQFGSEGVGIAERYDVHDRRATFVGVSASYDPRNWFAIGEWGRINAHSVLGEQTGWYGSGGYRFGRLTTFATYGQLRNNRNTSDPGITVSGLPSSLAPSASYLNDTLNTILGSIAAQKTTSIGARWDFMPNVDLKFQYDHLRPDAHSSGTQTNLQPGFQPGRPVNIISLTFDFVF